MLRDTQLWVVGVLQLELAVREPLVPMQAVLGMFNGLCCKRLQDWCSSICAYGA